MKRIIFCFGMFLCFGLSAQELDPEKAFNDKVSQIDNVQELLALARETSKNEQYARQEIVLKQLVQMRPYNADLKFELIKSYALQDKKTEAYNDLILMQKAGLSYPVGDLEDFDNIKGTKVYEYIEDGMIGNASPFGEGKKVFEVSDGYSGMLFENIAFDAKEKRFLLGSIRAGSVYQYSEKQGFKEFINPTNSATGPWGIVDLVIDDEAGVLWTASATMPHYTGTTQANFGAAMISKFNLSTGALIQNFAMAKTAGPMLFSQLHVTTGQNLYFINVFNSDVFKISKDSDQVEPMFTLNSLKKIKSLTTNSDETILYISDYDLGIFVVNLESKQAVPLFKGQDGFFAGINDLFYDEGDLVAIQSGVKPARLMRYVLKEDLFLQNMFPIEASHPNFESLGNGTLVGDFVYYAANSQWEKMNPLGTLLPDTSWDPLVIMKSPTKYRMEEHLDRQQRMEEIKKKRGKN